MIIQQLLDLSTTVSGYLIYFNINQLNDVLVAPHSPFPSPSKTLRVIPPYHPCLVTLGKQEMSISIGIDRHNYQCPSL